MNKADLVSVYDVKELLNYAIVSPNKKEAMLAQVKELNEK